MEVKYCKNCLMPNTRPGIKFDENGICSACNAYKDRERIDWNKRYKELEKLCDKYRGMNGKNAWDCAIAVSGGKDSHYQVDLMKNKLGMNPILFTVEDNFPMTNAGIHNLKNISEEFGCELISLKPNIQAQKKLMRYTFEKYGKPTWYIDRLIYTYPLMMALKFNTPLLVYGENVSHEYGGSDSEDTYSARGILKNGVASDMNNEELIREAGVSEKDLYLTNALKPEDLEKIDPIYISYFIKWNSFENLKIAKEHGFRDLTGEWERTHHVENFDQIDSRAYLVHSWMKYPKFGHQAATDYASRMIRYGLITREEGIKLIKEHDAFLDPLCVHDFCEFVGYTETEFWNIVDKFYNPDLFEKQNNKWHLKKAIGEVKNTVLV